jgi:hypothetical protein
MRYNAIFLVILALFSSFVVAESDLYFKQSSKIDLQIPCTINGHPCNSTYACNISVIYPNSSIFIDNALMSYNALYHNFTLPDSSLVGEYRGLVYCSDGTYSNYNYFNFKINSNGDANNNISSLFFFLISLIVICIVLSIFFYYHNIGLFYLFMNMGFGFLTVLSYFGWQVSKDWGVGFSNIIYGLYWVFLILTTILVLFAIGELIIFLIQFYQGRQKQKYGDNLI